MPSKNRVSAEGGGYGTRITENGVYLSLDLQGRDESVEIALHEMGPAVLSGMRTLLDAAISGNIAPLYAAHRASQEHARKVLEEARDRAAAQAAFETSVQNTLARIEARGLQAAALVASCSRSAPVTEVNAGTVMGAAAVTGAEASEDNAAAAEPEIPAQPPKAKAQPNKTKRRH